MCLLPISILPFPISPPLSPIFTGASGHSLGFSTGEMAQAFLLALFTWLGVKKCCMVFLLLVLVCQLLCQLSLWIRLGIILLLNKLKGILSLPGQITIKSWVEEQCATSLSLFPYPSCSERYLAQHSCTSLSHYLFPEIRS